MDELQTSFSEIMRRVESGDTIAEHRIWNEFYEKLLRYIEIKVHRRGVPTGLLDEEAVTASVLESVFKCAKQGRLQSVQNWSELSRLLMAMTNRKFVDHWRRATALKASPGTPVRGLSEAGNELQDQSLTTCTLIFEEQLARLLDLLPDEVHRQIAVLKLAEYTLAEISDKIQCAIPTVNRKWRYIRRIWANELQ